MHIRGAAFFPGGSALELGSPPALPCRFQLFSFAVVFFHSGLRRLRFWGLELRDAFNDSSFRRVRATTLLKISRSLRRKPASAQTRGCEGNYTARELSNLFFDFLCLKNYPGKGVTAGRAYLGKGFTC